MDSPLPDLLSPTLLGWLEQRGGAYLVAALWIWHLLKEQRASVTRSEKLSDALCQAIERGSSERARMADEYRLGHDWTVRSLLDWFRDLTLKQQASVRTSEQPAAHSTSAALRGMPSMNGQPSSPPTVRARQPSIPPSDDPQPPPLPQPPTPRSRQR